MKLAPMLVTALAAAGLCVAQDKPADYTVETGTKVPLSLINSVSTKHSVEGDRVYLETVFPVLVNGRIVVPVGSYVAGTVTQIKSPGASKAAANYTSASIPSLSPTASRAISTAASAAWTATRRTNSTAPKGK
ncbi:MAG: hypothetical protein JWP63_5175 [Candidatus Solibacter sp.]|nr:hypothetical protein [Candidatus Solibacter sp.]